MATRTKRKVSSTKKKPAKSTAKKRGANSRRSLRVVKGKSKQIDLPLAGPERAKRSDLKLVSRKPAAAQEKTDRPPQTVERRATAESLAAKQRDISVSEFFTRNRHLLGFDNPQKALLTTIKEAVDNSLDACEEAGILPDLEVTIQTLSEDRFRVSVQDNGPGIVKAQIPKIFAK